MLQSLVTIITPLDCSRVLEAQTLIANKLGNPARFGVKQSIEGIGDPKFVHFASLHAVSSKNLRDAFLVLEFSADGDDSTAINEFAKRMAKHLEPIYALGTDWPGTNAFAEYLRKHSIKVGQGPFQTAGLTFSGTPHHSVRQIEQEAKLADSAARVLTTLSAELTPLERLNEVRGKLADQVAAARDLQTTLSARKVSREPGIVARLPTLGPAFLATFLWPLLVLLVPLAVWLALPINVGEWRFGTVALFGMHVFGLIVSGTVIALTAIYVLLRRAEDTDPVSDRVPSPDELAKILQRENSADHVQNHMLSHTELKPGLLRAITVRFAYWAVARLSATNMRPGFLGGIGTIHFARWVVVPSTRDVLFFSNYGGSWESYLEDFITKAHQGLTGIWSNTVGFPRTSNLFFDGATDGERFKRFARQSMVHTPFWYCAYPDLTTESIRTNSLIRSGLSAATTSTDAVNWLSLFGSSPRPEEKLETSQIQSIVFGGLGFKSEGRLLAIRLGHAELENRKWLNAILPRVCFNDGRYIEMDAVLTIAFSPHGMLKLDLPKAALDTFPEAFVSGMRAPGRERVLGDIGVNAEDWWWGAESIDIVLLVYAETRAALDDLTKEIDALCLAHGGETAHRVDLAKVRKSLPERAEPFGFVDGVSQPAIRGTYRGLRNADPIHLVEPGEFIVGYPDNRGNIPPGPTLEAKYDPDRILPAPQTDRAFDAASGAMPRLLAFNGSYLVIRQLEQYVEEFNAYCQQEAAAKLPWFPPPTLCDQDFIAAKLIGRWRDGSSLVRNPYMSASELSRRYGKDSTLATMREESSPHDASASPIATGDRQGHPAPPLPQKRSITPDNDFLFGIEDPQGLRCPYGAHVRRANPRDSFNAGSMEQIAISNRHRIIRIGRLFEAVGPRRAGLMFMCLNADIERQFEFIQQTWMGSTKFHGLHRETDPIVGHGNEGSNGFTLPTRGGPVALKPLPQFVRMRGGGYFFLPGRQLLKYLSS